MKQLLITIAALALVGCGKPEGDHPFATAVRKGNIDAVKQHLATGMDVNAEFFGSTALNSAAYHGHTKIAELLLSKGANINWKDEFGSTPLQYATDRGHKETIALLRKHGGKTGEELKAEGK